jgi:Uma2 family endonuclease
MSTRVRFTTSDLALVPDDGNRYEIIDGDLHVSTQPHWRHQYTSVRFVRALDPIGDVPQRGITIVAPGLIFAEDQAVTPDIVWISRERLGRVVDEDGKLHGAPDLVVEILSPGRANEERDRELKLKLYSRYGVREYWIVDWREPTVQVFRREHAALQLVATLTAEDSLTSPLLPGFSWRVRDLCAAPE